MAVAAAGNVYRHEYDGVDEKLIWHTVRRDLSALRAVAAADLEHLRPTP
ncbi:MAG: HepT-like ribonuclease domain-containing protein [Bryobacteraceae bacterium]